MSKLHIAFISSRSCTENKNEPQHGN